MKYEHKIKIKYIYFTFHNIDIYYNIVKNASQPILTGIYVKGSLWKSVSSFNDKQIEIYQIKANENYKQLQKKLSMANIELEVE